MKKLILIVAIVFSGMLMQAQEKQLITNAGEIGIKCLGLSLGEVEKYFSEMDNWNTLILANEKTRVFTVEVNGAMIFVRMYYKSGSDINRVIVKFYHDDKDQLIERSHTKDYGKYKDFRVGMQSTDVIYEM